eukprot:TRINITY_DN8085_c0_g1_i1.p2 TRINITY_DN8085_c0_g1~~TRINITY_DN8085_c0_g1_i1.p2  ORF type:complete len:100 (+),score=23.91 TRINITY_DN8085_c0_g1_i1:445-744(+)
MGNGMREYHIWRQVRKQRTTSAKRSLVLHKLFYIMLPVATNWRTATATTTTTTTTHKAAKQTKSTAVWHRPITGAVASSSALCGYVWPADVAMFTSWMA